ncbi:MAG: 3-oxoacyl-[acyl-carrier-protein] reductase FabG [Candidatus Heimdallarchaeota archaeon LC_3]|nr:MAG: 3-oxoacyl-[acyl-carrier-protein] reductase FabG [Candidatus Heimdallarchaeota archaeon LC_3]
MSANNKIVKRFLDKIVVITGGNRGIGKEIAIKLSKLGVKVVVTATNEEKINETVLEIKNSGGKAFGYLCDVSNPDSVNRIFKKIDTEVGSVDFLINNAGIGGIGGSLWTIDQENWWKVLEVNLRGPMLCTQAVLTNMIANKSGTIINMGSYAGIRPLPYASSYSVSKAALIRFSDSIAESVKEYGINVFTVSPGLVLTDMTKDVQVFKDLPDEAWSSIEKISELVVQLLLKDVSSLTGRFIHVNQELDGLIQKSDKIQKEGLYTLRLAGLDGLIE